MNSKNYYIFFLLFLMIACSQNENIEEIQEDELVELPESSETIIVNGTPMYAGYGYDPAEDRAYRNAIYPEAVYESTDIQPALSVEVITIDEQQNLETFNTFYKVTTKTKKRFFGLFKKSVTTSEQLETRTKVHNTRIGIIVKITTKTQRFLTDASATLIPPAKRLLERKQYDRFLDNYGPYYIADRTVGGELYYSYVYEYCGISNWSKYEFKQKAKSSILKLFKKQTTVNVSTQDQQLLNQSLQATSILSNVPGFAPRIIRSINDATNEISSIQNYLQAHPEKATTIAVELKPYETLLDDVTLENISNQKQICLEYLHGWNLLHQKIYHIYTTTKNNSVKQEAGAALQIINNEIRKATSCENPTKPNEQRYQSLLREVKKDQFLKPVYRYYNRGNGDHFYTTSYNELGGGRSGYVLEGIQCKVYETKIAGTLPVYRYYNRNNGDHFYTTNYNELGGGRNGYVLERILGYVYPNYDCDRIPLYRYYNSRNGDHFYTTNYHELGGGRSGYIYEGILGYVAPK
ncbi:conserved hypothetical protein [Tenacibaculum amylolyticum]